MYMLMDLEYINEDTARHAWCDVRFWSEEVVHKIAEGSLTWNDEYRIDMLRFSLTQQSRKGASEGRHEEYQQGEGLTMASLQTTLEQLDPPRPAGISIHSHGNEPFGPYEDPRTILEKSTNLQNYFYAKIPVPSVLNCEAWADLLTEYHDANMVDNLRYWWPGGYTTPLPVALHAHILSSSI